LELLADETKAKDEAAAQVAAAQARVEQANIAAAEAKLQLDRMTVRAPIDGRVFRLIGHPGARIGGGSPQTHDYDESTIVTMYRPDMLQVRVDVSFEDIPKVQLGQPVQIENPALKSPLTGSVLFLSSEADIQKNTLQVKVAIDSPPRVLKPEMLVDVTFLAPPEEQDNTEVVEQTRIYVPQQFVQQDDAGTFVWVADQSARVARRVPVETGVVGNDGITEIVGGLTIASRVIASGHEGLQDGDRIRIVGEESVGARVATGNGRNSARHASQGEAN
jgi:RND family efflux transporter MFP subunit